MFNIAQKSSKFLLEIVTLVSPANIMGSYKVIIVGRRLLIRITKKKGL
jgi:hypothetical protein